MAAPAIQLDLAEALFTHPLDQLYGCIPIAAVEATDMSKKRPWTRVKMARAL